MSGTGGKGFPFAKIVAVLAIAFGVGVGLCGISFVAAGNGFKSHEEFGVDSIGIGSFSLLVMMLSAVGLVLSLVAWAVAGTVMAWRETGEPQALLGKEDDEQKPR